MLQIPFVDLKAQNEPIQEELVKAVSDALLRAHYILGKDVEVFEQQFASFIGVSYGAGVASGLDALILAMKALQIKAGDEVIVPANTFVATALGVSHDGGTPVLVDCTEDFNIDPTKIESKITSKTVGIIPVHLTGNPCEMDPILELARRKNIWVIEDAAQAHGAT